MKQSVLYLVALAVPVMLLTGCQVDPSFDFSKLDMESTFLKGAAIPIGNPQPVMLDDLLNVEANEYFYALENGDYHIHVPFETVRFDVNVPFDNVVIPESGQVFDIPGIPEFLSGQENNVQVELSGVEVSVQVESAIPETVTIGTQVDLSRAGEVTRQYGIQGLSVASGKTDFLFSETGEGNTPGVVYKALPQLDKFFSPVPDKLIVNDFTASVPALTRPGTYPVTCLLTVDSPIAFSADSRCDVVIEIPDAQMDQTRIGIRKAVLTMDAVSTVPLEFSLSARAMDGEGGYKDGITASTDVPVAAGTLDSPATTALTVTLTTDGELRFQGVELRLQARSNASVSGVRLNRNQGIELKNLALSLPDGITVSF